MSYEELKQGTSDHTQSGSDNDCEFREWIESVGATQDEFKTLVAHSDYTLYQAKQHVREAKMVSRAGDSVLEFLSQLQGRYMLGSKQMMRTFRETGHHSRLRGQHETLG